MDSLVFWWSGLDSLTRWFYGAAAFFSVFFIWQMIMAVLGLGGESDVDTQVDVNAHASPDDIHDTVSTFKLLSLRSILAFFTLFTWAGALYLDRAGEPNVLMAMAYATAWGIAAMLVVSLIFYFMRRMTQTGNIRIDTTVGANGTVYLDISAGGEGEVRVPCSGIITHFKARAVGGVALKAGTPVRVVRVLGPASIEVEQVKQ